MIGTTSICKHQKEYDEYIKKHNIYTSKDGWGVNVKALAKYIKENHISEKDVNDELVEKFKTK